MRLSARVDYALRALSELAAADAPRTVEQLSEARHLPNKYLESILGELRRTGLLRSQRGPEGGYRLARPAEAISIADVIRALDGELYFYSRVLGFELADPVEPVPIENL